MRDRWTLQSGVAASATPTSPFIIGVEGEDESIHAGPPLQLLLDHPDRCIGRNGQILRFEVRNPRIDGHLQHRRLLNKKVGRK